MRPDRSQHIPVDEAIPTEPDPVYEYVFNNQKSVTKVAIKAENDIDRIDELIMKEHDCGYRYAITHQEIPGGQRVKRFDLAGHDILYCPICGEMITEAE